MEAWDYQVKNPIQHGCRLTGCDWGFRLCYFCRYCGLYGIINPGVEARQTRDGEQQRGCMIEHPLYFQYR